MAPPSFGRSLTVLVRSQDSVITTGLTELGANGPIKAEAAMLPANAAGARMVTELTGKGLSAKTADRAGSASAKSMAEIGA